MCRRTYTPVQIKDGESVSSLNDRIQGSSNETNGASVKTSAPAVAAPTTGDGGLSQETLGDNGMSTRRKGKRGLKISSGGGSGNSTGLNI